MSYTLTYWIQTEKGDPWIEVEAKIMTEDAEKALEITDAITGLWTTRGFVGVRTLIDDANKAFFITRPSLVKTEFARPRPTNVKRLKYRLLHGKIGGLIRKRVGR